MTKPKQYWLYRNDDGVQARERRATGFKSLAPGQLYPNYQNSAEWIVERFRGICE